MRTRRGLSCRSRGYAVIEATITLGLVSMVLGGFVLLLQATQGAKEAGGTRSELQEIGRRAMSAMLKDLRNTGIVEDVSGNYPAIYERPANGDDEPRGQFIASLSYADIDNVDYVRYERGRDRVKLNRDVECREIVFKIPMDYDGNGYPVDDAGVVEWSNDEISYRVVTHPDGRRWLERRTNDGSPKPIAPYVDKITFDCILNDRSLLYNQIAVVIYLRKVNHRGDIIEAALEGIANLRNSEPID